VRTAGIVQDSRGKKGKEEDVEGEGRMVGSYSHVSSYISENMMDWCRPKIPLLGTDHNQLPCLVVGDTSQHVTLPKPRPPLAAPPVNAILHKQFQD
jgi:hypothetical protein